MGSIANNPHLETACDGPQGVLALDPAGLGLAPQ